jgi:hypothetical protein
MAVARFGVLFTACALSSGCATTRYSQSRIETAPHEGKGRRGEAVSLKIEGLEVRVESLDRTPRGQGIPNLALRLVFDPGALGYSFDPGQVVLRGADGREWRAAGSGYQAVYPKAHVDLVFDTAVGPEGRMDLVLGGLARGTRRLEPVTLRLARHSGTSIDRMYWLEAVGYMLSAAAYAP